jgi:bacteriocin-like protein
VGLAESWAMIKSSAQGNSSNKIAKKPDVSSTKKGQVELSEKDLEKVTGGATTTAGWNVTKNPKV